MSAGAPNGVPFVDLARVHEPLRGELDAALAGVVDSGAFILGPDVGAFEREWAEYCGAEHAVGVASGTAAIELALDALGVGPGDEVIAPALTFLATVLPALHVGAKPVLVDCDPVTATIDPSAVERALGERTKAIMAVHLYGQPADMQPLREVADAAGVPIVEDAAQAHGARYQGRRAGSLGRIACFSFYPSKNLGALGDGGAVVTDDAELAEHVRRARDLGQVRKYEHVLAGRNERLDTLHAAVLRVKLRHLDVWNESRREAADAYARLLSDAGVDLPAEADDREHVWHLYVVRSDERDRLREELADAGVATGLHYPLPIHLEPVLASLGHSRGDFPVAEDWSFRGFSLPMFGGIEEHEVAAVADALARAAAATPRP